MQPASIHTVVDFRTYVRELVDTTAQTYTGTLESYLRALWSLIQHHRQTPCSYSLFGQLLRDAFTTEPVPFDERWMAYQSPPDELLYDSDQIEDDYLFVQKMVSANKRWDKSRGLW